jgi:hypothetical protein
MKNRNYSVYSLIDGSQGKYTYGHFVFHGLPFYIGISNNCKRRYSEHLSTGSSSLVELEVAEWLTHEHNNKPLKAALNFLISNDIPPYIRILKKNLTKEEALKEEARLIKLIGRKQLESGPLCNSNSGGGGIGMRVYLEEEYEVKLAKYRETLENMPADKLNQWRLKQSIAHAKNQSKLTTSQKRRRSQLIAEGIAKTREDGRMALKSKHCRETYLLKHGPLYEALFKNRKDFYLVDIGKYAGGRRPLTHYCRIHGHMQAQPEIIKSKHKNGSSVLCPKCSMQKSKPKVRKAA